MLRRPPKVRRDGDGSGGLLDADHPKSPREGTWLGLSLGLRLYLLLAIVAVAAASTYAVLTLRSRPGGVFGGGKLPGGGGKPPGGGGKGKGGKSGGAGGKTAPTPSAVVAAGGGALLGAADGGTVAGGGNATKPQPAGGKSGGGKGGKGGKQAPASKPAVGNKPAAGGGAVGVAAGKGKPAAAPAAAAGAPEPLPPPAGGGDGGGKKGGGGKKSKPPKPPPEVVAIVGDDDAATAAEAAADLEDAPPVFSDQDLGLLGADANGTLLLADDVPLAEGGADDAAGGAGMAVDEDAPPAEFTHDDDPAPAVGHDEVHRPFAGRGCTFKMCNKPLPGAPADAPPPNYTVGGVSGVPALPLMYVVVPHRNRVDNIVRLLTSLNNATTPAQRACLCVLLTDFNTSTTVIPAWKNSHCLVSYRPRHNVWMDDEAYFKVKELKRGDLKLAAHSYAGPPACPNVTLDTAVLRLPSGGGWQSATEHFPGAHLDVHGLTGRQAVRHALAFYDGESAIVDGNKYVKDPKVKFSRAGGIMAGIDAIQTPGDRSLVFICDADMIVRPGFVEDMVAVPVPSRIVFMPVIWSMCWGATLEDAPRHSKYRSSRKGFWRPGGRGMVVAYLSDIKAVGGMR